ncbi:peptidoglycan D,D-transpeptidase FtsI family protein [Caldalkalibacillus mannanilyticus]|uniref:peptidoglycan D,D-transpeptidase FtsI family protein n=1 Tax=Caldalkalibacillus mannanilyticus TaxID=1418 RepID=UPI00046892FC|nr:penicillin-binding protein 2 [Caldalkalibacillus mannanilyticus]
MPNKKKLNHLSLRLSVLFLITFLLFSALVFRLGYVQIVKGEEYLNKTESNSVKKVSVVAPRGWIMDRNGEIMVYNEVGFSLVFTLNAALNQNREEIAEKLAPLIDMEQEEIFKKLKEGVAFRPQRIKQELNKDEMARVAEHLHELPGVDIIEDPIREYKYGSVFRSFLGTVKPISAENVDYYLSKGYRMDEMVGTSYIEQQYEEELRGREGVIEVYVDKKQKPIGEPVHTMGQRGNDLVLSIDLTLQKAIEDIIEDTIKRYDIVNEAYFVAMDPNTGEILGMSNSIKTVGTGGFSYAAGSTVKMATVLMGLHEGIVTPQTRINDRPMQIGNLTKRSWKPLGSVNAYEAIQKSSNIYMFNIGLKMANYNNGRYYRKEAFDEAFYYFSQFGLGVKTGIDLPNEYEGYKSNDTRLGLLADYMIGQYHNYTPLQLAQYVSTIANGGYRLQPYLVKEIRRGAPSSNELGQVIMQREPTILNRIDMSEEHIRVVQKGMEMVTASGGGTAAGTFGNFSVKVAGKTGTAQTVKNGKPGLNNTVFVGYAPADNPQIAFACIVPESQKSQSQGQPAHAQIITKKILEVFFGLNKQYEVNVPDDSPDNEVDDIE